MSDKDLYTVTASGDPRLPYLVTFHVGTLVPDGELEVYLDRHPEEMSVAAINYICTTLLDRMRRNLSEEG